MTNSNSAPEINLPLVKRLISGQFPQWADLPLELFNSSGTENAIYRLGEDMFVRLPRGDWAIKTGCSRGICFPSKAGKGCVQRIPLTTRPGHAGVDGPCQLD